MTFSENIKKYFLPALLLLALAVSLLKPANDNLHAIANKIQQQLNTDETCFEKATSNKSLRDAFANGNEKANVIEELEQQNILLYYYKNDSLLHWTSNSVLPLSLPAFFDEGTSLVKLKNGWYQATKYSDTANHETILGLVSVKNEFPFENKFLKNDFTLPFNVPHNIQLSDQKIEGSVPVKNSNGETIFSLYVSVDSKEADLNLVLLLSQIVLLLIVFFYIHRFAVQLSQKKNFIIGFSFLVLALAVLRAIMLWFDQPGEFYKLELFDPKYYASSVITKSLGDLIINSFLVMWIVLFYTRYQIKSSTGINSYPVFKLLNVAFVFVYSWLVWWVFKTLVMDSVISFEVYNVLSLNTYSLLGILCIALLLVSHFVITKNIFLGLQEVKIKAVHFVVFTLFAGAVFVAFSFQSFYFESLLFTAVWSVGFLWLFYYMLQKDQSLSIRNLIIYIALYSLLAAFLIENIYERKERNQRKFFSGKLVNERDYIAEYMFNDVAKRIKEDGFIRNSFANPIISKKEIYDRISSLYLAGYFNKYNLKLSVFDALGNSLQNDDTLRLNYYQQIIENDSANAASLHYVSDTTLNYSYLSIISIKGDSTAIGSFVLRLVPKIYYGQNVYPELLLGNNVTVSNNTNNYAYAIYQNDKLIAQYGDFPYSYYWNKEYDFGKSDFAFVEEEEWEHSIQHFLNGKKVMVSVPREPLFEPVATFSYFFTFFSIATLLLLLLLQIIKAKSIDDLFPEHFSLSFRTRINYSMLAMIVISFVIIGFITISFFSKQYDNFYTDRLLRKEKVVHASLEYFIQKNRTGAAFLDENTNNELNFEVARLADINSVDINLFNRL